MTDLAARPTDFAPELAAMAGMAPPRSEHSPAAQWLRSVAAAMPDLHRPDDPLYEREDIEGDLDWFADAQARRYESSLRWEVVAELGALCDEEVRGVADVRLEGDLDDRDGQSVDALYVVAQRVAYELLGFDRLARLMTWWTNPEYWPQGEEQ